ncbi:MAG: methylmalonyl-CoA mutase, partial [Cellvibrionaceae bacterium]
MVRAYLAPTANKIMIDQTPYSPKNSVRIVTAASLFDGHDAAINIMRRILQSTGGEIIHLGHDRSVQQIVNTAIQEDAQAIAITSYQGGHMEFFKYAYDLLQEAGCSHIKLFGGGGGTILPSEIDELHAYGIDRIYSPDDGRQMGLQGMINDLVQAADFPSGRLGSGWREMFERAVGMTNDEGGVTIRNRTIDSVAIGRLISAIENENESASEIIERTMGNGQRTINNGGSPVLGITGTGGAGKSSLVDELVRRFLVDQPEKTLAIVSVDPTRKRSGGALLGDRIRMNSIYNERVYMRSLATRGANISLSKHIPAVLDLLKAVGFDLIILETSGIGQSGTEIVDMADTSLYVMTPEFGAASQLEKIDMLDFADVVAINKFDRRGAADALRDVQKQVLRNRGEWHSDPADMPVFGTTASQFNDPGVNTLYNGLMGAISEKTGANLTGGSGLISASSEKIYIIPPKRVRYLAEIADNNRKYDVWVAEQAGLANSLQALVSTQQLIKNNEQLIFNDGALQAEIDRLKGKLTPEVLGIIEGWEEKKAAYAADEFTYQVRGRDITVPTKRETLSRNWISRVALPRYSAWGDIVTWCLQENVPGEYPYTAGAFPFKRQGEDPTRMFAGEGGPERTNKRFHYVSAGQPAKRLSTAFDSVTLYGNDPARRPDIYGKVGNSGVSVPTLDDAKRLYSGFDLINPATSVSMTINGPAATMLAFFMNVAIDQECEKYILENGLEDEVERVKKEKFEANELANPVYFADLPEGNNGLGLMLLGVTGDEVLPADVYAEIKTKTLTQVRGTIQADILKEDQAQNTCIYSTEFSLRLMGDIQQYFIDHRVKNFYSVSISGYHMAEAGANPISQLAFTLANGFTFLEYYLSRGMDVNEVATSFSYFFSNGVDPEYAVIGRVARRLWAKALKHVYDADERAQKLKYHIQTSGRSLHAQEISFNDIRTTLQALTAIYDNANSLHTNAYDEAITTPTEESVRRAMAIQLIINREWGLAKNENPLQGAFIIEELTDLVEEAVLQEFERLTERGGVLGAMETMYQRSKIQEESLYYETLKHNGDYPIIGVNTFLGEDGSPTSVPLEVIRADEAEKVRQIERVETLAKVSGDKAQVALRHLQEVALKNENTFEALMEAVKVCSLGQITNALFEVGGQYRR